MSSDNSSQSGLEKFFDITKPVDLSAGSDELGWEELKAGVADNLDRARVRRGFAVRGRSSVGTSDTVGNFSTPKCLYATDCGSNFTCVGGKCISWNEATTDPAASGGIQTGGTMGGGTCQPNDVPESDKDCKKQNCSEPGGCGDNRGSKCEINSPADCCGGTMYRCAFSECPQCEPCEEPYKLCTTYCDSFGSSLGFAPASCDGKSCGECAECEPARTGQHGLYDDPFECVPKENDGWAPCNCFGENNGCSDCEKCNHETGDCAPGPNVCQDNCNCFVKCPCGITLQGTHSQDHYQNGPVCVNNCRSKLFAECDKHCPPRPPACKADPNNPCEVDCYCKTYRVECGGGSPPCPSGKKCSVVARMNSNNAADGSCIPYDPQTGTGGVYVTLRICTVPQGNSECEECDCNCENDCPDCYVCGINGQCVYDPDCDDACEQGETNCDGQCCDPGQECLPQDCVSFTDACHGVAVSACGPAGSSFGLAHFADIPAESAVCGRFHTHCYVTVNGVQTGHVHYDCQAGLPGPTRGSGFACAS